MNTEREREAIARIIDPYAMGEAERDLAEAHAQSVARELALAKADAILARRVVKITPAMIRVVAAVIPGPGAYDIAHDRLARALAIAALTKGAEHG